MPADNQQQRVRNACEACHERKIKCKISPGGDCCQTCAATGRHCFFLPRIKAGRPRRKPLNTNVETASSASNAESSSHATSPRSASPATTEEAQTSTTTSFEDSVLFNGTSKDFDASALLTPSFPWPQLTGFGSSSNAAGQDYLHEANPFDHIIGDASNDMDTDFDAAVMLHDLPVPALSPDGSRDSASSMQSGPPTTFPTTTITQLEGKDNPFFAPQIKTRADESLGSPSALNSPLNPPTFQDLLVKSSEIERLLDSLQYASLIGLNLDTSSTESGLHKMIQSIDSAGELVISVLSSLTLSMELALSNEAAAAAATATTSPRLHMQRQQQQMQRHAPNQSQNSQQMLAQYNISSVNPAFLTKPPKDQCDSGLCPDMSPQSLAIRALALALSLRILDACDALSSLQPSNPHSETHIHFLRRLDTNLVQVRTALQHMELTQSLTRDGFLLKARHRTLDLHTKLKTAMDSRSSISVHW